MKKLSIFEAGILGLFIGVVIATYLTFIISSEGVVGNILSLISLQPILNLLPIAESSILFVSFAFFVFVYLLYGLIIGTLIHFISKPKILIIPLVIIMGGIGFEEFTNRSNPITKQSNLDSYSVAAVVRSIPQTPKQYFGNEAIGDLDGDNKDDVAFLIHRDDEDRGTLYYLTTAIGTSTGYIGTNLIFLGEKITPQNISIEDSLIIINYITKTSSSTQQQFAHIKDGILEKTTKINTEKASTTEKTSI